MSYDSYVQIWEQYFFLSCLFLVMSVLPFLRMNIMKVVFFYEILKNTSKLSLAAVVQI